CELERLLGKLNISESMIAGLSFTSYHDRTSPVLSLNGDRCLACGRCVAVCSEKQGLDALRIDPELLQVVPVSEYGLAAPPCIGCGQCTLVCPAGALMPRSSVTTVESTLISRERYSVALLEPAAAALLMSELGLNALPRLIGILHKLGFQEVVDAAWGADLYMTRLAEEFNADDKAIRLLNRDPSVERYLRQKRPDLLGLIPTLAPPTRLAALTWRRFIATEQGLPPGHCYLAQITTETGNKESLTRYSSLATERGLDATLTVRELTSLIRLLKLDSPSTKPRSYAKPRGSGIGSLMGVPGSAAVGFLDLLAHQAGEKPTLGSKNYLLPEKETQSLTLPGGCPAVVRIAHGMKAVVSTIEDAEKLAQEDPAVVQLLDLSANPGGSLGGGGLHRLASSEELQRRYQALLFLSEGASVHSPHQKRHLRRYLPKSEEDEID
ncbi:hypothetical protein K8R78_07480, partial [bacterium]|nr:hypothetical protein [bacterium]